MVMVVVMTMMDGDGDGGDSDCDGDVSVGRRSNKRGLPKQNYSRDDSDGKTGLSQWGIYHSPRQGFKLNKWAWRVNLFSHPRISYSLHCVLTDLDAALSLMRTTWSV